MGHDAKSSLIEGVIAVINTAGGSVNAESPSIMGRVLAEAGFAKAEVVSVGPEAIERALSDAARRAGVVVVLGGDGTIRTAAEVCGDAGKKLILLPGGTMNMLPRAIYGAMPWEEALRATLAAPEMRDISGGLAGGLHFYCMAILGAPSLWADAREALRRGHLLEVLERSLTAIRRRFEALEYRFDDKASGPAEAIAVVCPLMSKALPGSEPSLEAAVLAPMAPLGVARLAFHAIFDDWRRDPSISLVRVNSVRVSAHGRVPVILDGEKAYLGRTVTVTFIPKAFQAIVPAAKAA